MPIDKTLVACLLVRFDKDVLYVRTAIITYAVLYDCEHNIVQTLFRFVVD